MPVESFDEIRTRVLTDNTAQGVLNHLKELESNRAHMRTRWVWELLQNARDVSAVSDTGLVASIEQNQEEIVFRHNGADFQIDEITHLIYHGSTKIENVETIGQYGSGFLTTHLLSPEIHVSGKLDDGQSFEFPLKREVSSVSELSESMEQAWSAFTGSLSKTPATGDFSTEFRYPLRDDAFDAVAEGIETLKQCAPFVVVFNQEFSRIDINSLEYTSGFKVIKREHLEQDGFQRVTVAEIENGEPRERTYLLSQGEKAAIAVPLEFIGDDVECLPFGRIPRLFLGFPLIGTENFSFPAIINSLNFTPTKNRDGVYLDQSNDEANIENQAAIEEACDLLVKLLQYAASTGWRNAYMLSNVPDIRERDWLNSNWLRNCLVERLVEKIRQDPVVINGADEAISPNDLKLPLADTDMAVEALWDLLDKLQGASEGLPRRNEATGWCEAAKSWARISECEVSSFNEVTDGRKLASWVHQESHEPSVTPTTHRIIRIKFEEGVDAVEWLDQLIAFLNNNGLSDTVREYRIVPSQGGFLHTLPNLHRDCGIDEELKGIAGLLGWHIRLGLLDTRITSLSDEAGTGEWDNEYVVGELIKRLQERAEKNPDNSFGQASVRLFAWIVSQENWELLRGFQVFSERGDSEGYTIIKLERSTDDEVRPLAPIRTWAENLQPFSELFPRRHILSNAFFEAVPSSEVWQVLEKEGFLRKDVIITSPKKVDFETFLPHEPLADGEHETSECVLVTDVAFISRDNIGIMARVRDSQRLARIFWRFVTDWLIVQDSKGLETNKALCGCGETHRYYPAEWLVPLHRNRWVPLGGDKRGQVTAQSLADLLRGSGWEPSSVNENLIAVKLLEAIGITRFDLVRAFGAATNEERQAQDNILTQMLVATGGDIERLNSAYRYIEDLNKKGRIVNENQRLGNQVEELVKQSLKAEGFEVRRTGVGSDFEIEYDVVENDEEVGIEVVKSGRTWLVEVKATRDQRVRMTDTQARKAVAERDGFLLCVVPIERGNTGLELDDVRTAIRFVANIGDRVDKLCDDLNEFKELHADITADESAGVQLEVESGTARIRVASSVWRDDGFPLDELSSRLSNS